MENFVNKTCEQLNLKSERCKNVELFYNTVSYYKMRPYIDFIKNNPEIETRLKEKIEIKDSWDSVTFLYRYNIKLSTAIYAYIYILEIAIKTKINNLLINNCGKNWYADFVFINRANKKTIPFLQKTAMDYLKVSKESSAIDFVENHTTFGYWVAIIDSGNFWNDEDIKIKKIFSKNGTINPMLLKHDDICKKLKNINDLRNYISHQNRIIGRKIGRKGSTKYSLIDIYNNIIQIFELLGCKNLEWIIGDLYCNGCENCLGNNFKKIYDEYDFICESEIKIII